MFRNTVFEVTTDSNNVLSCLEVCLADDSMPVSMCDQALKESDLIHV
jgi:hypothetical protein